MSHTMLEFHAAERYAAPAERLWEILADLAHPGLSEGFVKGISVEGSGAGAVRTFHLLDKDGGGTVAERIGEFDPVGMRYTYRVFDVGPFPFAELVGDVRVARSGAGASVLAYSARFLPIEADAGPVCLAERAHSIGLFFQNLHRLVDQGVR